MKILGQIVAVHPLALIISLPNQLYAHVPITNVSSQYTNMLERMEELDDDERSDAEMWDIESKNDDDEGSSVNMQYPELLDMFSVGQYVRAIVTAIHAPGSSSISGFMKSRDELVKASKRVELSLAPEKVNAGVQKPDLRAGFVRKRFLKCYD